MFRKNFTLPFEKITATDLRSIGVGYYQVTEDVNLVHQIMNALYQLNIQSVIVEGGARLLQSFIDDNSWDEARIISNQHLIVGEGLAAPVLKNYKLVHAQNILTDIHVHITVQLAKCCCPNYKTQSFNNKQSSS